WIKAHDSAVKTYGEGERALWGTLQQNQTKHDTTRRQARRYIRDFATEEDISELKTWIELVEQRKNEEIK
ncbi:hypothetical protein ABT356_47750, partial [Streptosporangium roseum]